MDLVPLKKHSLTSVDVPGLAIGIVAGDRLVYAKGFGVRSKTLDSLMPGTPVRNRKIIYIRYLLFLLNCLF